MVLKYCYRNLVEEEIAVGFGEGSNKFVFERLELYQPMQYHYHMGLWSTGNVSI